MPSDGRRPAFRLYYILSIVFADHRTRTSCNLQEFFFSPDTGAVPHTKARKCPLPPIGRYGLETNYVRAYPDFTYSMSIKCTLVKGSSVVSALDIIIYSLRM